jgi:amino acid transporter
MTLGTGSFKRSLSALDLLFIGLGSIFGSGWLFAASHVASLAGPAGVITWIVGGLAVLILGLVYCELGAALPTAGGPVRYPAYSHGPLPGFLTSLVTVMAQSSVISIEVVAARQYVGGWFPALNRDIEGNPTLLGWLVQFVLLGALFLLNRSGISTFAKANNLITAFKFIVPTLVVGALLAHFRSSNFTTLGFSPSGMKGLETAISTGGVMFAYLGLTPIASVAGEVKNPRRAIPIAMIGSVVLSMIAYAALQAAFVGSLPDVYLADGWQAVDRKLGLPYHDITIFFGMAWLGIVIVFDAVLSPLGTANVCMSGTPRLIYAWASEGTFFRYFKRIDDVSGVPRPALWLSLVLAVFWTLPFPSWGALIGIVSSAQMMSYTLAPVTAAALRKTAPSLERPFRLGGLNILGPLCFAIATMIVLWSGWEIVRWLLAGQIVCALIFLLCARRSKSIQHMLSDNRRGTIWILSYYAGILLLSWLAHLNGRIALSWSQFTATGILFATIMYFWGRECGNNNIPPADFQEMREEMPSDSRHGPLRDNY